MESSDVVFYLIGISIIAIIVFYILFSIIGAYPDVENYYTKISKYKIKIYKNQTDKYYFKYVYYRFLGIKLYAPFRETKWKREKQRFLFDKRIRVFNSKDEINRMIDNDRNIYPNGDFQTSY